MRRTLLATLALSAALVLAAPAAHAQYPVGELSISLPETVCPPDGSLVVNGSIETFGGPFSILLDGDVVFEGVADEEGNLSVTIQLPDDLAAGEHIVTIVDETTGKSISATIVCPAAAAAPAAPGLAVTGGDFKVWMLLLGGLIAIGAVALIAGRRRARRA